MLGLAGVLSRAPRLLLIDELSFGLAPLIVRRLMRAVRDAADSGTAVVIVEQFARLALAVSPTAPTCSSTDESTPRGAPTNYAAISARSKASTSASTSRRERKAASYHPGPGCSRRHRGSPTMSSACRGVGGERWASTVSRLSVSERPERVRTPPRRRAAYRCVRCADDGAHPRSTSATTILSPPESLPMCVDRLRRACGPAVVQLPRPGSAAPLGRGR